MSCPQRNSTCCRASILRDTQNPTGHSLEQPAVADPVLSSRLGLDDLQRPSSFSDSVILCVLFIHSRFGTSVSPHPDKSQSPSCSFCFPLPITHAFLAAQFKQEPHNLFVLPAQIFQASSFCLELEFYKLWRRTGELCHVLVLTYAMNMWRLCCASTDFGATWDGLGEFFRSIFADYI